MTTYLQHWVLTAKQGEQMAGTDWWWPEHLGDMPGEQIWMRAQHVDEVILRDFGALSPTRSWFLARTTERLTPEEAFGD